MKAPTSGTSLSELQQHLQHLWDRIKHENDLINHRLSWLWTLQGLLFAAFGLIAKETKAFGELPISVICGVGIVSCLSVGYGVWKGHQVLDGLKPVATALAARIESSLSLEPKSPTPQSSHLAFLFPWRCLPWIMLIAWLLLLGWAWLHIFA